jgi:hypothetical protein
MPQTKEIERKGDTRKRNGNGEQEGERGGEERRWQNQNREKSKRQLFRDVDYSEAQEVNKVQDGNG